MRTSSSTTAPHVCAFVYHFTGKERDVESNLDYFGARYYASNMGRWMSPDWAKTPEGVPYADLSNPQSLNLYGYVLNNPLSHADADGHCCESDFNSFSDHPGGFTGGSDPMDARFAKAIGTTTLVGLGAGGALAAAPEVLSLAAAADTTAKGLAVGAAALNVTGMGVNAVTNAVGSATGVDVKAATNAVTVATNPIATVGAAVTGSAEKGANMADLATVGKAVTGMMQGRAPGNPADVGNSVGGAVDAVKSAFQSVSSSLRPAAMSIQSPAAPGRPSCSVAGAC
jgi:RHS repeat-associated protein